MKLLHILLGSLALVASATEPNVASARDHLQRARREAEEASAALKEEPRTAFQAVKETLLHPDPRTIISGETAQAQPTAEHPGIYSKMREGVGHVKEGIDHLAEEVGLKAHPKPEGVYAKFRDGVDHLAEEVGLSHAKQDATVERVRNAASNVKDAATNVKETVRTAVDSGLGTASGTLDSTLKALHLRERSTLEKISTEFSDTLDRMRARMTGVHDATITERVRGVLSSADTRVRAAIQDVITTFNDSPTTEQARAVYEDALQRSMEKIIDVRGELSNAGLGNIAAETNLLISAIGSRTLGQNVDAAVNSAASAGSGLLNRAREVFA